MQPPVIRGMAVPMHSIDPYFDYMKLIRELPSLGVTHISLFLHIFQRDETSPEPKRHPLKTPSDRAVLRTIQGARKLGLEVCLFPSLLLEQAGENGWKGNSAPRDRRGKASTQSGFRGSDWGRWFRGYRREVQCACVQQVLKSRVWSRTSLPRLNLRPRCSLR